MQLSEAYLKRRQEWKAEGLEEGQQLALRSVAVSLLQEGIEPVIIAKTTGLPIAVVEQLRQTLPN